MFKQVLLPNQIKSLITINDIPENYPIFVKKDGKMIGMIELDKKAGYFISSGNSITLLHQKYYKTRHLLLSSCQKLGFTFCCDI